MPVAFLIALALSESHLRADWSAVTERMRSVAQTYKKWGISFEVEGGKEFEAGSALVPGKLEVTGTFTSEDALELKIATQVGEKHAMAFEFGGTYKIEADGTTREGQAGFFLEGAGISGKYESVANEAPKIEGAVEEALLKFGIQFGKSDEGPFAFEVKLGKFVVKIDPTKYATRLRLMGPEMVKKAGEKIGGVTLEVDADAMAYALAGAPIAPPDFLKNRLAISLKNFKGSDLGDLNDLEGVLVDDTTKDLLLVGVHNPDLPAIPAERVATVVRTVFEAGLHPFISIDPQGSDFTKPNVARIGGIPEDLQRSSLIQTMLEADYAMKQITIGTHALNEVPALSAVIQKYNSPIVPSRFWINPAPLRMGDIELSKKDLRRYYAVHTSPVVLTEPLQPASEGSNPLNSALGEAISQASEQINEEEAGLLTQNFYSIAKSWPDSHFGEAEQALELTNIFTLLSQSERQPWTSDLLHKFGSVVIPKFDVPSSFPALKGAEFEVSGQTTHVEGGMTTQVEMPILVSGADSITDAGLDARDGTLDLGVRVPRASEPAALDRLDVALRAYSEAKDALRRKDYEAARDHAKVALSMAPGSEIIVCTLLDALDNLSKDDRTEFESTLVQAMNAHPNSWRLLLFDAQRMAGYTAKGFLLSQEKEGLLSQAINDLKRVSKLMPDLGLPYALQAKYEHQLSRDVEALKDWNEALNQEPLNPGFYYGRAGLLASQGNLTEAKKDLDQALSLNPKSVLLLTASAEVKHRLRLLPEAIADLRIAVGLAPTNWEVYAQLGKLLFESGDDAGTIEAMTQGLLLTPTDFETQIRQSKSERKVYPLHTLRVNRWEDFTKRSGEPQVVFFAVADSVRFDPDMVLLRAKSEMHLAQWAKAKEDLEAFRDADFGDKATKTEVANLLKTCNLKLTKN
jgi:tetratricopeptide (TPR) repeat protein